MSYEIILGPPAETGESACDSCGWHESAASYAEVTAMRGHAAEHVITYGHTVDEHAEEHLTIRPRTPTDY